MMRTTLPVRDRQWRGFIGLFAFFAACLAASGAQQEAELIRSQYTKYEYRIPMRDGVRLFTAVYVPNDRATTYPILMTRTPYSVAPYGADRYKDQLGPAAGWAAERFIFVYQDVRGRAMSEGEFVNMRPEAPAGEGDVNEATDTWDTIEWLLRHVPNNNGRVGLWGISYPGFYSSAGAIDSHPALVAVSPQAPIADWFWDDMHRHGAFILPMAFNFFASFGQPREGPTSERPERFDHGTPDGYQFFLDLGPLKNANERYFHGDVAFWNDIVAHPNYDEFWQARNILPYLRGIKAAVLVVGGWFDTEDLYGPLATYRTIEQQNPKIANSIVMGPWAHGGWSRMDGESLGEEHFGFPTSEGFQQNVLLPFFRHYLKGGQDPQLPEALVFETGANRWRSFDAWPPPATQKKRLYLRENRGLSFEPPEVEAPAFDDYVSDPSKPVPYTMEITNRWARDYMTEDQRFAAWRPDVLVYRSEILADDLTLAGPVLADLRVSTTGTDADWIVKIIDEYPGRLPGWDPESAEPDPGGRQQLVRAEAFRGRFRDSYEHPEPFTPGEVATVAFELHDFFHTFERGHRVMVQVQSTWFPFVDRNPQRFVPNIFEADEDDFIVVTNRIHRSRENPSSLEVGVLPSP